MDDLTECVYAAVAGDSLCVVCVRCGKNSHRPHEGATLRTRCRPHGVELAGAHTDIVRPVQVRICKRCGLHWVPQTVDQKERHPGCTQRLFGDLVEDTLKKIGVSKNLWAYVTQQAEGCTRCAKRQEALNNFHENAERIWRQWNATEDKPQVQ